jgi:MerR family mercuric resistance operon transcriptional regulator
MPQSFTIGQLAFAAGVNVETVRYYQRRNLMHEPPRPPGGTRRYSEADAQRLRFIKRAQVMGFALADIENLLQLGSGKRSCRTTRELALAKLEAVDERIRELRRLRKELASLVAECDQNRREAACPIIERLSA